MNSNQVGRVRASVGPSGANLAEGTPLPGIGQLGADVDLKPAPGFDRIWPKFGKHRPVSQDIVSNAFGTKQHRCGKSTRTHTPRAVFDQGSDEVRRRRAFRGKLASVDAPRDCPMPKDGAVRHQGVREAISTAAARPRSWPNCWSNSGRSFSNSGRVASTPGQCWSIPSRCAGPTLSTSGQSWPNSGLFWSIPGQSRSIPNQCC